jgi:hypothetical protein
MPACGCLAKRGSGSLNQATSTSDTTKLKPQSTTASTMKTCSVVRRDAAGKPLAEKEPLLAPAGRRRSFACKASQRALASAQLPLPRSLPPAHRTLCHAVPCCAHLGPGHAPPSLLPPVQAQPRDLVVNPLEARLPQRCQAAGSGGVRCSHHSVSYARIGHVLHPVFCEVPLMLVRLNGWMGGGGWRAQRPGSFQLPQQPEVAATKCCFRHA